MPEIDFVTVVYAREVPLLRLQARSLRKLFDPEHIGRILILVNEDTGEATAHTARQVRETVLPEYGTLGSRVSVLDGAALLGEPVRGTGWKRQQTLKLLASAEVHADVYVALDAKNHFIRPADASAFIAADGRMKSFRARQQGSLKPYFVNSCTYFDLDPARYVDEAMPATTPFPLSRTLVREMIHEIEKREAMPFARFFHTPRRNVTEFFLYFAFLTARHSPIDAIYAFGRRHTVTLFTRWPETPEKLAAALAQLSDASTLVFGLHSNRARVLDADAVTLICRRWVESGLFSETREAASVFAELRALAPS
jgi:hypothetical protein